MSKYKYKFILLSYNFALNSIQELNYLTKILYFKHKTSNIIYWI